MPWTPKQFASKHNHRLKGPAATKAASIANAMLRAGVPEGEAIATANKRARAAAAKMAGKRKP
jgi:uncharacterized protein YdaT